MRLAFGERLMAVGAVAILLIVLAASDDRVRDRLLGRAGAPPAAQAVTVVARVRTTADTVGAVVRAQSRAHTLLLMFSVAAAILVVFMLRT